MFKTKNDLSEKIEQFADAEDLAQGVAGFDQRVGVAQEPVADGQSRTPHACSVAGAMADTTLPRIPGRTSLASW
jgi:hypothetical protein